jgi:hypothetical protein
MASQSRAQYELHDLCDAAYEPLHAVFPADRPAQLNDHILAIADNEPTWVGFDDDTSSLVRVPEPCAAAFGVQVVHRKLTKELALVPVQTGILVNSIPALGVTLLGTRDSISAGSGRLLYVTQRVRPHIGPPTEEMLSARAKCPFCKLTVAADTVVVSCRCGAVYHRESEATHPQLTPDDRLSCQTKISTCLACGRLVSLEESLDWNPATL